MKYVNKNQPRDIPLNLRPCQIEADTYIPTLSFARHFSCNNTRSLSIIATVVQHLQGLALHVHSEKNNQVTGCMVCGKSYNQVIVENGADSLHHTTVPGEAFSDHHIKRQAFEEFLPCGVVTFLFRGVSPAAACDSIVYQISNRDHWQAPWKLFTTISRLKAKNEINHLNTCTYIFTYLYSFT